MDPVEPTLFVRFNILMPVPQVGDLRTPKFMCGRLWSAAVAARCDYAGIQMLQLEPGKEMLNLANSEEERNFYFK
jgi:hypothetical protein